MTIHTRKAQGAIDLYKSGNLPKAGSETIESKRNIVDHYTSIRDEVASDDNGPLDSDPRDSVISYNGGDRNGFTYTLSPGKMRQQIGRIGYTSIDEYTFREDGSAQRISAHHQAGDSPAAGQLSVDEISAGGHSLDRQSWWFEVKPELEAIFTPNFQID